MKRMVLAAVAVTVVALAALLSTAGPAHAASATITSIVPLPKESRILITFDAELPFEQLRDNLRVIPPVRLAWYESGLEKNVLRLQGAFRHNTRYRVYLPQDRDIGGRRYQPGVIDFIFPSMPAEIAWAEPKTVIERDSRQLLHLKVANADAIVLEGLSLPPVALPLARSLAASGSWPIDRLEKAAAATSVLGEDKRWKPFLGAAARERQLFPAGGSRDTVRDLSMPLTFRREKEKGAVLLLRVLDNAPGSKASAAPRLVRITDLGLTWKRSEKSLLLWVTSLGRGLPLKNARVLLATSKGELFPAGQTDGDGVFLYEKREMEGIRSAEDPVALKRALAPSEVFLVVVVTEDDLGFAAISGEANLKPRGIAQVARPGERPVLKGHLFTERGVYRAGDTVHLKGVVREYREGTIRSPEGSAWSMEIRDPRGDVLRATDGRLGAFGSCQFDLVLGDSAGAGTYTATLRFGQGPQDTDARTFQVQAFKPPRHAVSISFKRSAGPDASFVNRTRTEELLTIEVAGTYYAGGPVKHGQVRWKIYHAGSDRFVQGHDGYSFGYPTGERERELLESGEAVLDEAGMLSVAFPVDREVLAGRYGMEVVATVVDFDGRASSQSRTWRVEPAYLVGIGGRKSDVRMEDAVPFSVVVLGADGRVVSGGTCAVDIYSRRYTYVRKRNERGDLFWESKRAWKRIAGREVTLRDGRASWSEEFGEGGTYMLSATYRDGDRAYSSGITFDVSWSYPDEDADRDDLLYDDLQLAGDRERYRPGDTARLHLSPRRAAARYLITTERDDLLEYRVVNLRDKRSIDVPLTAAHVPNVYVSVLGVVPRGSFPEHPGRYDDEAPGVLFGTIDLPVLAGTEPLVVVIGAGQGELRAAPGAKVTIPLEVKGSDGRGLESELAVAVVDESVLSLTAFATPTLDPLTRFDVPLAVAPGDLRARLLRQTPYDRGPVDNLTGWGGLGGDADLFSGRARRRFDPVALWLPALRTGADGRAEVSFALPDTMTAYRVFVVAADRGGRFASGQRALRAVKDFWLEPGLPRFLIRGDTFSFDVAAFSALESEGAATIGVRTTGPLEARVDGRAWNVPAQGSVRVPVEARATASGKATLTVAGELRGSRDVVELSLPVLTGAVMSQEIVSAVIRGTGIVGVPADEESRKAAADADAMADSSCLLTVSATPFARLSDPLRYLLGYPYGCVEQMSSGVLPLAALRGLVRDGFLPGISVEETDRFLSSGVTRLLAMQNESGGFGYWPGYGQDHPWGSVYALAALSAARDAGAQVKPDALQRGLGYLKTLRDRRAGDPNLYAYATLLLASAKVLPEDWFAGQPRLPESREAAMLVLLGMRRAGWTPRGVDDPTALARRLIEAPDGRPADEFRALHREKAVALLLAVEYFPGEELTEQSARRLLDALGKAGRWHSTADTGWALLALGSHYRGMSVAGSPATITVAPEGGPESSLRLEPRSYVTVALDPSSFLRHPSVRVSSDGGGDVHVRLALRRPRPDYAAEGHEAGFLVSKSIENMDGAVGPIRVGDMVRVTVQFEPMGEGAAHGYRHVALEDPLPAGLVAINSALAAEEPVPDQDTADDEYAWWDPDGYYRFAPGYVEIGDENVRAFRDWLWQGVYRFTYYARAVVAGSFTVPSTRIELMYDPQVSGYSPSSTLVIERRR